MKPWPTLLAALTLTCAVRGADPKPTAPINLGFNTAADEDDPHVTSTGTALYYSSNPRDKWGIYVSVRRNGPWARGEVRDDYIATGGDDRSAFAQPEGRYPQYLYYATTKDQRKGANFDLYVVVKQTPRAAFSAPTPVNAVCTAADEMHPWLSADGRSLYFSRKTDDGWRVFVSRRKDAALAAGFGEPELIKELPADFHHATLTPDGKTMYLQGPLGKGRWGLFVSTFDGKEWSKPAELDLNHAEGTVGDCSPCLTRDGKGLYFASDRPGGKGKLDVWAILVDQVKKK